MKKLHITAPLCALLMAGTLHADGIPQRTVIDVPAALGGTTIEWTVPHFANGKLLSVQPITTQSATAAVKHIPAGVSGTVTNTILATATNTTIYADAALPPTYLIPGDKLTVALSATNATAKVLIITSGR